MSWFTSWVLLCASPPYVRPTQDGIAAHIGAVASATGLPVLAYDVPGRTGTALADATISRLFANGLIVGTKDATADLSRPPRLRALGGEPLLQYSGDDATAAGYRAMGGAGCISVTANVVPAMCAELHQAWRQADIQTFAMLRDRLDPLHAALFQESNPIRLKATLHALGLCQDTTRLPLTRAVMATQVRLLQVIQALDAAERFLTPQACFALAS